MKKIISILWIITLTLALVACSNNEAKEELDKNDTEKAEAKVDNQTPNESEKKEEAEAEPDAEDIWTYYDDAKATETFEDLTMDIQKMVVSDKAPGMDDNGNDIITSAVGMKIKIENASDSKVYITYPDQATLVTSTGEQVEAEMFVSDHVGGEIHEGVIKEGNIIWYLERGHAEDIEWVKINWTSRYDDPDGDYDKNTRKEHSVKLELKQ